MGDIKGLIDLAPEDLTKKKLSALLSVDVGDLHSQTCILKWR